MKRFTALLLIAALLCSLFAGCAKEEEAYVPTGNALVMEGEEPDDFLEEEEVKQELTLAYEPGRSMNPLIGISISNRVLMSLIYQGLFAVSNKNVPTPILCSAFQISADNCTYTFYVDERAKFSDGTRVTNADVIATYNRAMENDYFKGRFFHLDRVEEGSDGGIVFFLTTPIWNGFDAPGQLQRLHLGKPEQTVSGTDLCEDQAMYMTNGFYDEDRAFFERIRAGQHSPDDLPSTCQSVAIAEALGRRDEIWRA